MLIGLGCLVLFSATSHGQLTAYLKIGDIQGESQRVDHEDEIDIHGISWSIEVPQESTVRRSRARPGPLILRKFVDASSPYLALAPLKGEIIPSATLAVRKDSGEAHLDYLIITMENVQVTSVKTSSPENREDGQQLREEVGLTFSKITYKYIDSESQAVGREGWIEALSLGADLEAGGDLTDTVRERRQLIIRKRIDKASPDLLKATLSARIFPSVLIEVEGQLGLETCYRLRGVQIAERQVRTDSSTLIEEYHFRFDVGEWHDFQNRDGQSSHVGTTWNFVTDEGGILDRHQFSVPTISPLVPVEVIPGGSVEVGINLNDPFNQPERLAFSVIRPDGGLVKILRTSGKGRQRTLELEAGVLENGFDFLTLNVSDGVLSSTRRLPILVAGERTAYESYLEGFLANQIGQVPSITRPLRDPDGDKLSNLMEFFLGTDPGRPTPRNQAFTLTRQKRQGVTEVSLRYFRRMDLPGIIEDFEGSPDGRDWKSLGAQSNPRLEVKQLAPAIDGYAPMEARLLVGENQPRSHLMRLSVRGTL